MLQCPHCQTVVIMKELPHQSVFASFRACPECEGLFTPDTDTKIRQALCILVALIALVYTLCLYFDTNGWLVPAISSYVALGVLIYRGNKKMYLVPYDKEGGTTNDT